MYCNNAKSRLLTDIFNSRQIRPPIYSLKQTKLRKRRVVRYAILYFTMFVIFLVLIVGPVIVGPKIIPSLSKVTVLADQHLIQPNNWNNNDTQGTAITGSGGNTPNNAAQTAASPGNGNSRRFMFEY